MLTPQPLLSTLQMRGTWLSFRALQTGEATPSQSLYGRMVFVRILYCSADAESDK